MCSVTMIRVVAFLPLIHGKATNQTGDTLHSMDELIGRLADNLFGVAPIKVLHHHAELANLTFGKPNYLERFQYAYPSFFGVNSRIGGRSPLRGRVRPLADYGLAKGYTAPRLSKLTRRRSLHSQVDDTKEGVSVNQMADSLRQTFWNIDMATKRNLDRILKLFSSQRIDDSAFHGVDGYGHGDIGREKMDNIVAQLMGAEAAHVRLQFFSGTHAISTALFAALKPGQKMLCVSGAPYDTLEEVIGIRGNVGSLAEWGIAYSQLEMTNGGKSFDLNAIGRYLDDKDEHVKLLHVQRSCGYQWRPSIRVDEIKRLVDFVKKEKRRDDVTIFVDNCYGELVEDMEPCHVGADLIAGSLIKNLGGTLAPSGGYVAGRADLVDRAAKHLAAPGVESGATFGKYKDILQGLFLAPVIVGESLKGAELVAKVFTELGFECNPPPGSNRTDIIQAVKFGYRDLLIEFCEAAQSRSPVGSYIKPVPGDTPGYDDQVIFADGTFVKGSTLELSADGPLREPYIAYTQGCTHWTHWALVLDNFLQTAGLVESEA